MYLHFHDNPYHDKPWHFLLMEDPPTALDKTSNEYIKHQLQQLALHKSDWLLLSTFNCDTLELASQLNTCTWSCSYHVMHSCDKQVTPYTSWTNKVHVESDGTLPYVLDNTPLPFFHTTLCPKWGGGLYSNMQLLSTIRPHSRSYSIPYKYRHHKRSCLHKSGCSTC